MLDGEGEAVGVGAEGRFGARGFGGVVCSGEGVPQESKLLQNLVGVGGSLAANTEVVFDVICRVCPFNGVELGVGEGGGGGGGVWEAEEDGVGDVVSFDGGRGAGGKDGGAYDFSLGDEVFSGHGKGKGSNL